MAPCLSGNWRLSFFYCCSMLKWLTGMYRVPYQYRKASEMGFFDVRFAAYLAVAALLIVTPGPDTALVTRNALLAGRRAASFTTLGIAVLLERSVLVFTVCKFAGAAYLGYLGLRSLVASFRGDRHASLTTHVPRVTELGEWEAFRQGLLNNLLNPKAGAIFASALPQFIRPGDSPLRLLLMMLAYETILLSWLNFYGYLVSWAGQSRFGTRVRDILHGVTGVVLIALGVRLAWEHQ